MGGSLEIKKVPSSRGYQRLANSGGSPLLDPVQSFPVFSVGKLPLATFLSCWDRDFDFPNLLRPRLIETGQKMIRLVWILFYPLNCVTLPSLFCHSWPYHLKYIKHFTKINSVLNYFYQRSLPLQQQQKSNFTTLEVKII